jgi:predicted ATPase
LFNAFLGQLVAESRERPVLMVMEDAHWIDPTSRELLDLTVDRVRQLPVLLAITFRPEYHETYSSASDLGGIQVPDQPKGQERQNFLRMDPPGHTGAA